MSVSNRLLSFYIQPWKGDINPLSKGYSPPFLADLLTPAQLRTPGPNKKKTVYSFATNSLHRRRVYGRAYPSITPIDCASSMVQPALA